MKTAVLFGDSITAGALVQENERYMVHLEKAFPDIQFVNKGVPGHTSSQGRERFETDVMELSPDLCVIFFGMNDTACDAGVNMPKVTPEQYEANLQHFVSSLQSIGCRIVLCTIFHVIEGDEQSYYYSRHPKENFVNPPGINGWLDLYSEIVKRAAEQYGTELADLNESFKEYIRDGGRQEDLLISLENGGIDDGVHPTPKGHVRIAHEISKPLRKLI
ncbi:SGNH/GDSL hydrolase family protein [Marinicrinis lubricantis]|uniref:SGNH/GDSL hydrolase family protein n=1 Tax=Marinicrinis lubricantis TaxID=2086470 RepID=A0ABW1IK34_9BACL